MRASKETIPFREFMDRSYKDKEKKYVNTIH